MYLGCIDPYFMLHITLHCAIYSSFYVWIPLSVSCHFAFLYCSWGSQGKNTEVVCHSLLQWSTFRQTSPPWLARLGWPHTAWLNFIELDKAVVRVIRLTSFLWLCFVRLLSDASRNICHLAWVSLVLDVGYLFMAAPAKHSCCSLLWMRGISSQPPLLTLKVEQLLLALLRLCNHCSLNVGLLFLASTPGLWWG